MYSELVFLESVPIYLFLELISYRRDIKSNDLKIGRLAPTTKNPYIDLLANGMVFIHYIYRIERQFENTNQVRCLNCIALAIPSSKEMEMYIIEYLR